MNAIPSISTIQNRLADRELFQVKETAELFGVDPKTVYAWLKQGKLKSLRRPGGRSILGIPTSAIKAAMGID